LHAALETIARDYDQNQVVAKVQALTTTLSNSIDSGDEQQAAAFNAALTDLYSALDQSPSALATPSRLAIFNEIGATQKIGHGLRTAIQDILEANNVTPANALAELQAMAEKLSKFKTVISQIISGFEELKIEYDELDAGETEVGVTIPFRVIDSSLDGLHQELHAFDKALKIFGELVEENPESPKIKTVGSSALQIFLDSSPGIALCLATAFERLCALYKKILEIKLLRKQLGEKSLPDKITAPIEAHERQIADDEIEAIAKDLIREFSKKKDKARENELRNGILVALRFFAEQIDAGVDMEVRAEPPRARTVAESEGHRVNSQATKQALEKARKIAARIQNAGAAMRALKRADGPILSLKEPPRVESKGPKKR